MLGGRYLSNIGLIWSGPGDFLLWKPLKASLSLVCVIQFCSHFSSSIFVMYLFGLYCVFSFLVALGKCTESKCVIVSSPGSVMSPFGLTSVPILILMCFSMIFLNWFIASIESSFSLKSDHDLSLVLSHSFAYCFWAILYLVLFLSLGNLVAVL